MKKEVKDLMTFWDNAFNLSEEELSKQMEGVNPDKDYLELAPSKKMYDALVELSKKDNILDYGSGNGWASIIMAKNNAKNIIGVDTAKNAVIFAKAYAKANNAKVDFKEIDFSYLDNEKSDLFDGIFCSNVLDVIPDEVSISIIDNLARIAKKDALVIIGLNYYLDLKDVKSTDRVRVEKNYYFIDNVLRLNSKKDSEWEKLFNKDFDVIKLEHFSWPGEAEEKRRLFYLKKK